MAGRSKQRDTSDSSRAKPISDMDPDGMDSDFEDSDFESESDLDSPENITESARQREQQTRQAGAPGSHDKENPIRSRRFDEPDESENGDEEDEDMEPRSTPRSASQPPHNRRESDSTRPSPPRARQR
jgi:hypothetical protein